MERHGLDQEALAARARVTQSTISKIILGQTKNSRHLPRIARELGTTIDYLQGAVDAPDKTAPGPSPQIVMLPVALPSHAALVGMYRALLRSQTPDLRLRDAAKEEELAEQLAELLPFALSRLKEKLHFAPSVEHDAAEQSDEEPSLDAPLRRRA